MRTQALFLFLASSLVLFCSSSPAQSQSNSSDATVFGTLLDASGAGVGDVHVTAALESKNAAQLWKATSATDGRYRLLLPPGRYRISRVELRELVAEFMAAGGEGVEVLSGSHSADETREVARLAREFKLLASRGSDFHGPGESWMDIGKMPALPDDLAPVWSKFKCMNHRGTETQR